MTEDRPPIPEAVKRLVRQQCKFGCAVCGHPICHYDHIVDWSEVKEHAPENLVLLCPNHHQEKTNELRTREQIREARAAPFNSIRQFTAPFGLPYGASEDQCEIHVGDNSFCGVFRPNPDVVHALAIDNIDILSFAMLDGGVYLNLTLFDETNRLVLVIRRNEMILSTGSWDIQFVGRSLVIRDGPGQIRLDLEFQTPAAVAVRRGRFLCNGVAAFISPRGIVIPGSNATKTLFSGCSGRNGILIGCEPPFISPLDYYIPQGMFAFPTVDRYGYLRAAVPDDTESGDSIVGPAE